jgi:transposase-like protein
MKLDRKTIYAQSSDIKSRTYLEYRRDMKKKAIAELEVSEHFIKNGKLHARQRYECKACGYNFTVSKLGKSKPPQVRTIAKPKKVGSKAISKTENKKLSKICIFISSAVIKTYGR